LAAQKFIPGALHKSQDSRRSRESLDLSSELEFDGGVALDTVGDIVRAGADCWSPATLYSAKATSGKNAKKLIGSGARRHVTRA